VYAQGYLNGYLKNDGSVGTWEQAGLFSTQAEAIIIKMSTGSSISGTVSCLNQGEYAWIDAWSDLNGSWGGAEITGTGSPVEFTIKGLAPGSDYTVSLWAKDYASETMTHIATDSAPVNFTVSTGQTISGSITGAVPNQSVWINAWSETSWNSGYAEIKPDENGNANYTMQGLGKASDYIVSASSDKLYLYYNQQVSWDKAEKVDLSQDSAQGIDINFDAIETYTLSGVIQGLEVNTNFVWIDAWDETTGAWGGTEIKGNGSFSIELPVNGNYKIGLFADMYFPVFFDSASGSLVSDWEAAQPVSVSADINIGTLTFTDDLK